MTSFAIYALAALPLAVWLYLVLGQGGFWRFGAFVAEDLPVRARAHWPRVVAVVPARNEAETISRSLASLFAQDYPGEWSVVVVDDHSQDRTAALAEEAAARPDARGRLRLVRLRELPSGWTGKVWALEQGTQAAKDLSPEYFWFTDADVVHAPGTLRSLVSLAEEARLDLASLLVLLRATSLPERLLIPPFVYFFLKLYPPRWSALAGARTAGAAGGSIVVRRTALEECGGLAGIRGAVIDDCALAHAVKSAGGRIWWGLTRRSVSLRGYTGLREIRDMIARTAYTQLQYRPLLLAGALAALLVTYLLPVGLLLVPVPAVRAMALVAWALMSATFVPTLRFYRQSPVWAPALPLAAAFYAWATLVSAVRYWRGRGGQWKGRAQAVRPA